MKGTLLNMPILFLILAIVVGMSVYMDAGQKSWLWFQRSGSIMALVGIVLSYRSIVRLGVGGVGGAQTTVIRGRLASTNDDGTVNLTYDADTVEWLRQAQRDKIAGYLGAYLIVIGTIVWGYGDLLGALLAK